jgi:hypothetical protein
LPKRDGAVSRLAGRTDLLAQVAAARSGDRDASSAQAGNGVDPASQLAREPEPRSVSTAQYPQQIRRLTDLARRQQWDNDVDANRQT